MKGGIQVFGSIFLSYLPYGMVTAFTPGPNNIISLHAVSQNGWRRGKDVLLGIAVGFLCVMVLCALFCYELARFVPAAVGVLKYVGAAYILWLAFHVARSKPETQTQSGFSFWRGFWLEFVNIKIILYAITIYTGYVLPHAPALPSQHLHAHGITAIGVAGTLTWAALGSAFHRFLQTYYRPFNYTMAAILVYCAITLALE